METKIELPSETSQVFILLSPKTHYFAISWLQCILTWIIRIFIIYRRYISLETIPTERMSRPILFQCRQLAISCHFWITKFYSFTFELQLNQLVFHVKFGIYHPRCTFQCFAEKTINFVLTRYILLCWLHTLWAEETFYFSNYLFSMSSFVVFTWNSNSNFKPFEISAVNFHWSLLYWFRNFT